MICPFCDSSKLRTSRFRFDDLFHLLLLRMPVRCRDCQERSYTGIAKVMQLRRESKHRREADKAHGRHASVHRLL
jgi:hypothetical protein